jgi:hypothetical protein
MCLNYGEIRLYGSPWMYRLEEQEQGRYCAMLSGNLFLAARSEPILEYDKALHSAQTEYGLDWGHSLPSSIKMSQQF